MKQAILFVATEDASTQITNIKKEVIAYLGQRMVEVDFMETGIPMIGLRENLGEMDKVQITQIVSDYSNDVVTIILHENSVGNLDKDRKIMEFIQYEEPITL